MRAVLAGLCGSLVQGPCFVFLFVCFVSSLFFSRLRPLLVAVRGGALHCSFVQMPRFPQEIDATGRAHLGTEVRYTQDQE